MADYVLEGKAWQPGKAITYSFAGGGTFTGAMAPAYQAIVAEALKEWAAIAKVTFTPTADGPASDIRIGWGKLDTSSGEIGETDYMSSLANPGQFQPGVTVRLEDPQFQPLSATGAPTYAGIGVTLLQVALHEVGHALGLGHSSQPTSVMYPYAGSQDAAISAFDVAGIQALYGANPLYVAPPPAAVATTATPVVPAMPTTTGTTPAIPVHIAISPMTVYRFFDQKTGTQFLSADGGEIDQVANFRKDLRFEGPAMRDVAPDPSDPQVAPVFRFFGKTDGTHFFTIDKGEAAAITATRPDMVQEASTFSEHLAAEQGDSAVYRFFDSRHGTHFFTASDAERASIVATRTDLVAEGVAFYAPTV